MNLFKLLIPSGQKKEIEAVQSFTVKWSVRGNGYGVWHTYFKVFTSIPLAREFEDQVKQSAKFIRAEVNVDLYKNDSADEVANG